MNTWNRMHLFIKIGLFIDVLSFLAFAVRIAVDGPFIMIPIQLGLMATALALIVIGGIKMRKEYYDER